MAVQPDLVARFLGATDAELGFGTSARYRIFIRGANYERLAELTEWTAFTCIPGFNDVGTWSLVTSSETLEISLLTKTGGIIVTREINGVERTVFSGFVWTEWGYTETEFRAAGYSDEALLWTPARPTPSLAGPPFLHDYDVRTGVASSIMIQLVNHNLGPIVAPAPWRIPALRIADDPLLGTTITSRANLQPLLTLLAELAITPFAGGLGFYMRQSDVVTNRVEFGVYAPEDRSADAKFSVDLGTVSNYEDFAEAPEANHVYVMLGDGFGTNRTIIAEQDDSSIAEWGRVISTVVDMRGTTDLSEGNQRAAEEIAKVSTLRRTAVVPFDNPSLQFGVHYDLGTLVTVVTRSGEVVDLIRQVEIDLDPEEGVKITPIVGQGDGSDEERIATITRTIQNRMSNLERNWNVPPDSIDDSMLVPALKPPIGKVEWLAHSTVPAGYLAANGQAVSRTTYADLFAFLGTTWGSGDGSTTFNVPDLRDRSPIGSGSAYSLGQLVGATSVNVGNHQHTGAAHTHPGSHSHSGAPHNHSHAHAGAPHTHPGSHSHGLNSHVHLPGLHSHNTDIDHNHVVFVSGNVQYVGDVFGRDAGVATGTGHNHNVDVPALGVTLRTSSVPSADNTGAPTGTTTTATDSTAHAASFSGNTGTDATAATFSNTTGSDSSAPAASFSGQTGLAGSATISVVHPSVGLFPVIYSGV